MNLAFPSRRVRLGMLTTCALAILLVRAPFRRKLNLREARNRHSSKLYASSFPNRNLPRRTLPCLVSFALILLLTASSVSVVFSQTSTSSSVPSFRVLSSPNYQTGGNFGSFVASDGNITVVSADNETVNGYYSAGRVYVYDSITGSLLRTLISPKLQTDDYFGAFLALGNGTSAIGTNETVDGYVGAGSIYVFNVTSGALIRELVSPHPQANGGFSYPYLIVNGTLVMGSAEGANGVPGAGILYLFSITSGNLLDNLTSPNPTPGFGDEAGTFGNNAVITGHTIITGAYEESVNGTSDAGRVYIFGLPSNKLVRTLVSPNIEKGGLFGDLVLALGDDRVAVGAQGEGICDLLGNCQGRVYIFNMTTGALLNTINSTGNQFGAFGWAIAASGDSLVVGAPFWQSGSAYVFNATNGKLIDTLNSPNPQTNGNFGFSVAATGDIMVIAADNENVQGHAGAGHVYIYEPANTSNSTSTTLMTTSLTTSLTTVSTTSVSSSAAQSSTSTATSTTSTTGGGVPEFPYQLVVVAVFTVLLALSYLFLRHRAAPKGVEGKEATAEA
jgi:FG-GAP repeat